jgi:hypothetical protein
MSSIDIGVAIVVQVTNKEVGTFSLIKEIITNSS